MSFIGSTRGFFLPVSVDAAILLAVATNVSLYCDGTDVAFPSAWYNVFHPPGVNFQFAFSNFQFKLFRWCEDYLE
jgi:hypothetical protein